MLCFLLIELCTNHACRKSRLCGSFVDMKDPESTVGADAEKALIKWLKNFVFCFALLFPPQVSHFVAPASFTKIIISFFFLFPHS